MLFDSLSRMASEPITWSFGAARCVGYDLPISEISVSSSAAVAPGFLVPFPGDPALKFQVAVPGTLPGDPRAAVNQR